MTEQLGAYTDLNELFNEDIEGFYGHFIDKDELMAFAEWRREASRREVVPMMVENPYGSNVVSFVILTPDPLAKRVDWVEHSFRHWTRIFCYGKNPYFNESRWFNEGIKRAIGLGSKWVVLMSDDLHEITPIQKLTTTLATIDNQEIDVVWVDPRPDYYHNYEAYGAERHQLEKVLGIGHRKLDGLFKKFGVEAVIASKEPIKKPLHYWAFNKLFPRPYTGPSFKMTGDFCILSTEWCKKQGPEVLNELFCGWEDMDLSMRLRYARSVEMDFRIGSEIGGTLGVGMDKALKELYNLVVWNEMLRQARY